MTTKTLTSTSGGTITKQLTIIRDGDEIEATLTNVRTVEIINMQIAITENNPNISPERKAEEIAIYNAKKAKNTTTINVNANSPEYARNPIDGVTDINIGVKTFSNLYEDINTPVSGGDQPKLSDVLNNDNEVSRNIELEVERPKSIANTSTMSTTDKKEESDVISDVDPEEAKIRSSKDYNVGRRGIFDDVHIIDSLTGKTINPVTFQDTIRIAGRGSQLIDDPIGNNIIAHKELIPTSLLSQFLSKDENDRLHSRDAISALGSYITEYMKDRVTRLDGANDKLDEITDKSVLNNMTFRNYLKAGGGLYNSGKYEDIVDKDDKGKSRLTPNLGIGLGEAYVLNPTFQFNKRDDPRTNPIYTKIGRVYSTQFMNNWPVALIQPGRLKYHTSFLKLLGLGSGAGAQEALIRTGGDGIKGLFAKMFATISDAFSVVGTLGSAIFGGSKVVEFKQSYNLFKQYSRFLYLNLAGMMGLINGNKYLGSIENLNISSMLPNNNLGGDMRQYLDDQYLPFRCGKGVTSSETFSNSLTSNPLMDTMNQSAEENDPNSGADAKGAVSAMSGDVGGAAKSFLKRSLTKAAGNFSEGAMVMSGRGRISLPDVFSSSSFSRSFSFSFKFHSPYGDNLSIFENEYIQFLTLLSMAAPRQTGKLSYTSPFAIRISVKNHIMINFGMIESLSITRGGDSNDWTPSGYPKTLTVELSVKDMEPNITLPLASRGPLRSALEVMFPATGISEYLASLGGLSFRDFKFISKNRFRRSAQMFTTSWNAKLSTDNMMSTVINASMFQNITNLFAASDLDRYYRLGDKNRVSMEESSKDMLRSQFSAPGFYVNTVALNGQGGMKMYSAAEKADFEAAAQVVTDSKDSIYPDK